MALQVVMVVQVVVLPLVIIIQEMVLLDKVMTAVQQPVTGYQAAAVEQEKQEIRIVKVTEVTV
jgi:hypothetical protein